MKKNINYKYHLECLVYSYFSHSLLKPGGPQMHTAYSFIESSCNEGKYLVITFSSICPFASPLESSSSDKM